MRVRLAVTCDQGQIKLSIYLCVDTIKRNDILQSLLWIKRLI